MPRGFDPAGRRPLSHMMVPLFAAAFLALAGSLYLPSPIIAQDDEAEAATEETAAADEAGTTEQAAPESFLIWMVRANGWLFGPIFLALSFFMVALIMMNILSVRRSVLLPAGFVEDFEQKLNNKDYQGAYERARTDESFIGRVLAAGLGRLNRGYEEAVEGMQEVGEDESMALEHRLSYLAMIGSIAPMLGLLGTVWGMIASFRIIANSAEQPKPKDLAEGISTALFTTVEGLLIAIPALIAYGLLRNRLSRLVLEIGIISENLMSRFSTVGKKPATGGAAPATAPAAPQQ